MKTLWSVLTTLAVANLLALAGFVAWLGATDRLSKTRLQEVRERFTTTVSFELEAAQSAKAAAEAEARAQAEAAKRAEPPESAAAKVERQEQAERVQLQQILRRQRELEDLSKSLLRERDRLNAERQQLAAERKAFEDYRIAVAATEGEAQFKKALATLESQKPKEAKDILSALLLENKTEQVVAYLSAMEERVRGKVLAEFVKEDSAVAADLLERLRTRGIVPPAQTPSS